MGMNNRLLRPRASGHPEALAWRDAVVANGGTVSASTLAAVTALCKSIDSAGIRDRFYRLNLFCGDNLTACLVPLYRGPSLSGTQFGNTTDTNVNFLTTDYVELGAGGGLTGNGSSKYLQSGIAPSAWVSLNLGSHLAAYKCTSTNSGALIGAAIRAADPTQNQVWELGAGGLGAGGRTGAFGAPGTHNSFLGVTRSGGTGTTTARSFRNDQFSADNSGSDVPTAVSLPFAIFARNSQGADGTAYVPTLYTNQRLAAYSVGLHLTNDAVVLLNNAMQTFQAALGRAVT